MIRMRLILLLLIPGFVFFGCYYTERSGLGYVELYPGSLQPYQLRVPHQVSGRGNVHKPFDFTKWEYVWADWLILGKREGLVSVEGKIMSSCPEGFNKWYGYKMVKGEFDFQSKSVPINLKIQQYNPKSKSPEWVPYQLNGVYRLIIPPNLPNQTKFPSPADCEPEIGDQPIES